MSRRASHTDEEILHQVVLAVRRHGPRVSLATLGREVGLTGARLVQRFGSRDQLLATAESVADRRRMLAITAGLDLRTDPLGALVRRLGSVADRSARRLYGLSRSYFFDPGHLTTAESAREAREREQGYIDGFRAVLEVALAAGQLRRGTDLPGLARAINVVWVGTYTSWAYAPVGSVRTTVIRDLEHLLAPYLAGRPRPAPRSRLAIAGRV